MIKYIFFNNIILNDTFFICYYILFIIMNKFLLIDYLYYIP